MREKQRLRAQYGISEKQLRAAYEKATRTAGQTGNAMLTDLETVSTTWCCVPASPAPPPRPVSSWCTVTSSLTATSSTARPIASSLARPFSQGQEPDHGSVPDCGRRHSPRCAAAGSGLSGRQPAFLKATLTRKPEAEEIPVQVNIQYVVEFYAR